MDLGIHISCSTCFAVPGEECRSKYLIRGQGEVTPVLCPTHSTRLAEGERALMKQALARQICAAGLECLERQRGSKQP
jgi:hypothetical protein